MSRTMYPKQFATLLIALGLITSAVIGDEQKEPVTPPTAPPTAEKKIVKSKEEWKKLLTPEQFEITRNAGTERPFGDAYKEFKNQGEGTYYCVCCKAELFTSNEKFDSACGWPSFYDPAKAKHITEKVDTSGGRIRTEVVCTKCDAHLGHVFTGEGFPTPTDKRYCINAAALIFVKNGDPAPKVEVAKEHSAEE